MTSKRTWRVALIGMGSAARTIHLPAFRKLKTVEIVGGSDVDLTIKTEAFPVFNSYETMISKTKPDIVVIVTPPDVHFEIAKYCLEEGCHVFCEKPFVNALSEARTLIELAKHKNLQLVVNQEFRCMKSHVAAKQTIGTDTFGDLKFLAITQTFRSSDATEAGWRGQSPRRTCYEFGTHTLDLCRYFYDAEPLRISALMPKPGGADQPDLLNIIQLEFSNDRYALIMLDRLTRGPHRYLDMRLDGTAATIETSVGGLIEVAAGIKLRKPFLRLERRLSASAKLYSGENGRLIGSDSLNVFANATAVLFEQMLGAIESGSVAPCSAEDNIHTLALMLSAYESADRKGETINVADFESLG